MCKTFVWDPGRAAACLCTLYTTLAFKNVQLCIYHVFLYISNTAVIDISDPATENSKLVMYSHTHTHAHMHNSTMELRFWKFDPEPIFTFYQKTTQVKFSQFCSIQILGHWGPTDLLCTSFCNHMTTAHVMHPMFWRLWPFVLLWLTKSSLLIGKEHLEGICLSKAQAPLKSLWSRAFFW